MYLIYQDVFVHFTKCCKNLKDLCSKFERSQQSKLDRGCSEAKSVNFKSQPQTLLKELFQLKPSENCCHCPLCILDFNSSCYSYTNSLYDMLLSPMKKRRGQHMKKSTPEATANSKCILRPFLWQLILCTSNWEKPASEILLFSSPCTFEELEIDNKNVEKCKMYHILQQREKSIW